MDLVLIPGALATPHFWRYQEQYFQDRANICHAPFFSSHSIVEMAKKMVSHLPAKFSLVAFSMGGYIAFELIRIIPDQIESLVLINSGARFLSDKGHLERQRSLALINNGKFDFLISLIFKNSIYDKGKHKELLPLLKNMAQEIGAEKYLQQLTAILNKPDHTELLGRIQCPTLLVASRNDQVMPTERSEHMAIHIKNSKLVYIEDCGHVAPLEQPNTVNRILSDWF